MEEVIKNFLNIIHSDGMGTGPGYANGSVSFLIDYGYGYGSGTATDYGDGEGDGWGACAGTGYGDIECSGDGNVCNYNSAAVDGSEYRDGDGEGGGYNDDDCSGDGYGYGFYNGISMYNWQPVYVIDSIKTIIDCIHGNYAKGHILKTDLTLEDCYIAKCGNFFAHGKTLKDAMNDASEKYECHLPTKERIKRFIEQYPALDSVAQNKDLYKWHHTLTGSCSLGRNLFIEQHSLDKDNGCMTVQEFIDLTKDEYGRDIIRELEQSYNIKEN